MKLSKKTVIAINVNCCLIADFLDLLQGNRAIFIEANIHAREWIASATATYVLNQLLRSTDPAVVEMALNIDWYIIPVTNIDGYEYTRNENRNWRKTRSPTSLICVGVDPNRNFAHNWLVADEDGDLGASKAPCSDTYAGPYAFSESETAAVNDYFASIQDRFDVYLSFHSYGHVLLCPYGTTFVRIVSFVLETFCGVQILIILTLIL